MEAAQHTWLSPRRMVVLLLLFAMSVVAGRLILSRGSATELSLGAQVPGDVRPLSAIFDSTSPLMTDGGNQSTLQEAATQAGYEIPVPNTEIAGVDGLPSSPEVWVSEHSKEIGLRYGSLVVIMYSPWPIGTDPEATYREQAAQFRAGYVSTIGGNPAWVVPKDSQAPGFPEVDVVHISVGSLEATLFGQVPMDNLIALAQTL